MPFTRNTLEWPNAAVGETQPGAGHEILYCARDQNLASTGKRRDARTDMDGDAANIVAHHFALAGMEPGANVDAERSDFLGNSTGATNATRRPIEGGEKAVTGRLHLMAAKTQ